MKLLLKTVTLFVLLALVLLFALRAVSAQEVCDARCVEIYEVRIEDYNNRVNILESTRDALQQRVDLLMDRGSEAGQALRNELTHCQLARAELVAERDVLFMTIEEQARQIEAGGVNEETALTGEWRKLRQQIDGLRLSYIDVHSTAIRELAACLAR